MSFVARSPVVALNARPWLTREKGECAFPVAGEGMHLQACCNPCGAATYCPPHAAAMRGPRAPPVTDLEREILRLLEGGR
jgi:hypothetical protein